MATDNPVIIGSLTGTPDNPVFLGSLSGAGAGGVADHGALTGLADDDHTQYALLAGRAGGQVGYGGNAANEDLTLNGTAHATKTSSYVFIQPNGGLTKVGDAEIVGFYDTTPAKFSIIDSTMASSGATSKIISKVSHSGILYGLLIGTKQEGTGALTVGCLYDVSVAGVGNTNVIGQKITVTSAGSGAQSLATGLHVFSQATGTKTIAELSAIHINPNIRQSGTVTSNYGLYVADQAGVGSSNWNIYSAGSGLNYFGGQIESAVVTGTAPLVIASTTKVANLNVDSLDDQSGSYYLDSANFTGTNWTDLTDGGDTTLHKHDLYALLAGLSGVVSFTAQLKFTSGNESIAAGAALLGANSPAGTLTAPYTWFKMTSSDGSQVYIPAWK